MNSLEVLNALHQLMSDMQGSILPTDCRGRDRLPLSLTQTITIDLANSGSPFTSTNTVQEHILIVTDCPWQNFSYDFAETTSLLEYDDAARNTFSNLRTILLCISIFYM